MSLISHFNLNACSHTHARRSKSRFVFTHHLHQSPANLAVGVSICRAPCKLRQGGICAAFDKIASVVAIPWPITDYLRAFSPSTIKTPMHSEAQRCNISHPRWASYIEPRNRFAYPGNGRKVALPVAFYTCGSAKWLKERL